MNYFDYKDNKIKFLDDDTKFDIITLVGFDSIHDKDEIIEFKNITLHELKQKNEYFTNDQHYLITGYKNGEQFTLHTGDEDEN